MTKKYISTIEAGKIMGISRIAIFKQIKIGKLPAIRIGRNYAIEMKFIQKLKSERRDKIKMAVKKAFKEYGDAIKKLGDS